MNCGSTNILSNAKKKPQCSTFKIATCETFLKITKISGFCKQYRKTMHTRKKSYK